MSIQQSFNQILGSAGIMGALYANSPAGKARFETKQATKSLEKLEQVTGKDYENIQTPEQARTLIGQENKLRERIATNDPKQAEIQLSRMADNEGYLADFLNQDRPQSKVESHAIQSQVNRVTTQTEQKTAVKDRLEILKDRGLISKNKYERYTKQAEKIEKKEERKNG